MHLPLLELNKVKQEGDMCVNEVALRLLLPVEQRVAINKVQIYLYLMLVSNLLIHKRNTIKVVQWNRLIDKSYTSKFAWPASVLSKREIYLLEDIYF